MYNYITYSLFVAVILLQMAKQRVNQYGRVFVKCRPNRAVKTEIVYVQLYNRPLKGYISYLYQANHFIISSRVLYLKIMK